MALEESPQVNIAGDIGRDKSIHIEGETVLKNSTSEFWTVISWMASGINQALFIIVWVILQWAVNEYIIVPFGVQGIDKVVLYYAQLIFAISTLGPIAFYMVQLLVTLAIRTWRVISNEYHGETIR